MNYTIELSKKGLPCMWEKGGGASNTGEAVIISDAHFNAKKPLYIKRKGHLACQEHALIPVRAGDHIIDVYHHRADFRICIYQIKSIDIDAKKASTELINKFSNGEWDNDISEEANVAVEVAKAKALDYHCRKPYYVKQE